MMNPNKRGIKPPRRSSWGGICCSHKQRQHVFNWMGARIVQVLVPSVCSSEQIKIGSEGGNPPGSSNLRNRSRRRTHRAGVRTSRMGRPTGKGESSGVDHPAPPITRPGVGKKATTPNKARKRFVNWVDRAVNRIQTRLISEIDWSAWEKWESLDFHPTKVPWLRFDRHLQFYRYPDRKTGAYVERECFVSSRRAYALKNELIRRLTEVKGRPPPPYYVENALAVKSRTWKSSGIPFPREGYVPFVELNRQWDGQVLRALKADEKVAVCAWCQRQCVGSVRTPSHQIKCPKGTGCRVWETRQAQTRRRKPKGSRH